jgi:uncharacterized small protein (DUF1192 family)
VHWTSMTELAVTACVLSQVQQLEIEGLDTRVRALQDALRLVSVDECERRRALVSEIIHTQGRIKRLTKLP